MCVIAVCNSRKLTEDEFNNCWRSNPDGFGVAWFDAGFTVFQKGLMEVNEAWGFYQKRVKSYPHVAHFRVQTAGGVCKELTHPFIVSKRSPLSLRAKVKKPVLFHNGCIAGWRSDLLDYISSTRVVPVGAISDTRLMAMQIGSGMEIEKVGAYQKVVIMSNGEVTLYGDYIDEDGVLYSNSSYKARYYRAAYSSNWYCGGSEKLEKINKDNKNRKRNESEYYLDHYWGGFVR